MAASASKNICLIYNMNLQKIHKKVNYNNNKQND